MRLLGRKNKYLKQVDAHTHSNKSTIDNLTQNVIDNINNLNIEVDGTSYTQDVDGKIALPNYPVPRTDDEIKTLADGQIASSKQILQSNDLKGITADSTLDEVVRAVQGGKVAILQSANFTNYLGLPSQMYTITISSLGYNRVQIIATGKYYAHDTYIGGCNNASGVDVYDKWIKVTNTNDITTTINSSSTDTQVPSAKSIYNKSKNKITRVSNNDIITYADSITSEAVTDTIRITNGKNSPYGADNTDNDFHYTIYNIENDRFKRIVAYDIRKNEMYMIAKCSGVWGTWERLCTTKVADVSKIAITWSDETYFKSNDVVSTGNYYQVKNGICYVNIDMLCVTPKNGGYTLPITLPRPSLDYVHVNIASLPSGTYEHSSVIMAISNSGNSVIVYGGNANDRYLGSFSYPVAES